MSEFYKKNKLVLKRILTEIEEELLTDNVPFWEERICDRNYGGFLQGYNRRGELMDTDKYGWFVGRTMSTFGSLYHQAEQKPLWLDIVKSGREYMKGSFCAGKGRYNYQLSRQGSVKKGTTSIFTDVFAVEGLYEYLQCMEGEQKAEGLKYTENLSDILFDNIQNPQVLLQEGIREGFQKHAICFMQTLVALKSRAAFGNRYRDILTQCVEKTLYEFASDTYQAPFENIGTDGKPKLEKEGRIIDPGHTMEALWFSMEAGKECDNKKYIERAQVVLDWVIDRAYDEEFGGFYQHVDIDGAVKDKEFLESSYAGRPVAWNDKVWWVQAEGLNALLMSALYNENERHFSYFLKQYDYVEQYFRDKEYGEWFALLKRDGSILSDEKGFELKGPYHVPRCLMTMKLLITEYIKKGEAYEKKA